MVILLSHERIYTICTDFRSYEKHITDGGGLRLEILSGGEGGDSKAETLSAL